MSTKKSASSNWLITGCSTGIGREIALAALANPPAPDRLASLDARRRLLMGELAKIDGVTCPEPRGAFYAFPNVAKFLDERGSAGFSEDLLEDQALAIVPGDVFGMDTHVRFSYATSIENIEGAITRLAAFLDGRK